VLPFEDREVTTILDGADFYAHESCYVYTAQVHALMYYVRRPAETNLSLVQNLYARY
jgi:hypothetical protein